ncbi:MAG: pentapeptide repeat-containing protein, partial [Armatimonadota bacterium]
AWREVLFMFRRLMPVAVAAIAAAAALADNGPRFDHRDLREAHFASCDLREAVIESCTMGGARLVAVRQSPKILLKSCRLDEMTWQDTLLDDPRMQRVRIEGLYGYDLELAEWLVERSELTDLSLRYCDLDEVELENVTLSDLDAEWLAVPRGRWRHCDLRGADFEGCDLSDSRFYRGSLEDARFTSVDFTDVTLERCDIRGLVINGVRIDELIE